MKVVTPEGYTFVTKFQEDNSHKVLRSVDFFSIKFDEIFFDTVCWVSDIFIFMSQYCKSFERQLILQELIISFTVYSSDTKIPFFTN